MSRLWASLGRGKIILAIILVFSLSATFQAQRLIPPPNPPGDTSSRMAVLRDTELLQNGGFETPGATAKRAANWTEVFDITGMKRACNRIGHPTLPDKIVAHEGDCAYQMSPALSTLPRTLKQTATPMGAATDTLELSFFGRGKNLAFPSKAKMKVTYSDTTKEKLNVVATTGTFAYTQFSGSMELDKTVSKIVLKLIATGSGKAFFDAVSLMHSPFGLAPVATDDNFTVNVGTVNTSNSVSTNDNPGIPAAAVNQYGLTGVMGVTPGNPYTLPGSNGITVSLSAAGALTVDSTAVGASAGVYTFDYQITNTEGSDTASVTITVQVGPTANNDSYIVTMGDTLTDNLTEDNGNGADNPGSPAFTSLQFGGGSAGGTVTSNTAPASIAFAGGTLQIAANGGITLSGTTQSGVFNFDYRLTNVVGSDDATVTIEIREAPTASPETVPVLVSTVNTSTNLLTNDDRGYPLANVSSFGGGDLGGTVDDNAPGATVALTGSGGITVSVASDGALTVDATSGTATTGVYTFDYKIQNVLGVSSATVTLNVGAGLVAEDDAFQMLVTATLNGDLTADNGSGPDFPGIPAYHSLTFGGGDAGGTITTNSAPASIAFAGGTLTVNLDGTFSLATPSQTGTFTFSYRLTNAAPSSDDATVTIDIGVPPIANDDVNLFALVGSTTNLSAGTLFANNGFGMDIRGAPTADIVSFGGGSIVGSTAVTDFAAGNTTGPLTFAGGTLTVNADGSFTVSAPTLSGTYTFNYRLENFAGFDDAQVTVTVREAPDAADDEFTFEVGTLLSEDLNDDNGNGADNLGNPTATVTSFGAGNLGGDVTLHSTPASVALAGGTLTVNSNGTLSLASTTQTGVYTFHYRLTNAVGTSDAVVTINVHETPVTADDLTYVVMSGATLNVSAPGLLDNDDTGFPTATISSYGGGDLGGSVTDYTAGTSTGNFPGYTLNSGTVQVNADGSFDFTPPTDPTDFCGEFDFFYRLSSLAGFDDGAIRVTVNCVPLAADDLFDSGFTADAGGIDLTGNLLNDNGFGEDFLGFPSATLTHFGGGDLGGSVTDNLAGASAALADGTLTINSDGSLTLDSISTPGTYTFQYRLSNSIPATDDATVTIVVDDAPTVTFTTPSNGATHIDRNGDITINFSETVDIAAGGITLECPVMTAVTFTPALPQLNVGSFVLNPDVELPGNTVCTVTLDAASISDTDTNDLPDLLDGNDDDIEGDDYVFSFTTAPVANDDLYTVTPHLTYDTANVLPTALSVRNNDDPVDTETITGFGPDLGSANGTAADGVNFITATGGGRVVLRSDGTFIYYPDALAVSPATASFFYTIAGGDTAQVTIEFEAEEFIWFVDGAPASPVCTGSNVGTQACPGGDLADIDASDTADDTIFIADGSYTCGITLQTNEKVIGDGASGITLEAFSGVTPVSGSSLPAFSGTDPVLTTTAASTSCFTLDTGNTIRGLTIGDTTGYSITSAIDVGTATVFDVSDIGTGGFYLLSGGGTFNASYNELTSTGHDSSIISLTGVSGTMTNTSGGISSGSATTDAVVFVSGGAPNLTFTGDITKTTGGRMVDIQNVTGGTIGFPGTITHNVATSTGILINNQTGTSAINFGTLNFGSPATRVTTTAITVTSGSSTSSVDFGSLNVYVTGTTAVSLTNDNGTISSTTGIIDTPNSRALNINGPGSLTTLDITLTTVNAGGGVNGILIQDTDGAFTITGSGGACTSALTCTGGAIQNTSGNGIVLQFATNISLNNMYIGNTGGHGVSGTLVSDDSGGANPSFELANSLLDSPGDADGESALFFDTAATANVTGWMVVSDTTIQSFEEAGIQVGNNSGALTIDVSGVVMNDNSDLNGSTGIDVAAEGTAAITLNVSSSTFTDLEQGGITALAQDTAILDLNLDSNVDTGTGGPDSLPVVAAWSLSAEGSGSTLTFDVANNQILDGSGDGVFIGHEGTLMGRVEDNLISGMGGDGVRIDTDATSTTTATILVRNNDLGNDLTFPGLGGAGIQALHRDGTKVMFLTVSGNRIANTTGEGVRYFSNDVVLGGGPSTELRVAANDFTAIGDPDTIHVSSEDAGTEVCAHISGNTGVAGITLDESSALLQITQPDTATLSTDNGGAAVNTTGTILFNGTCTNPPLPTNP